MGAVQQPTNNFRETSHAVLASLNVTHSRSRNLSHFNVVLRERPFWVKLYLLCCDCIACFADECMIHGKQQDTKTQGAKGRTLGDTPQIN